MEKIDLSNNITKAQTFVVCLYSVSKVNWNDLTIQIYLRKSPRLRMSILAFPWIV